MRRLAFDPRKGFKERKPKQAPVVRVTLNYTPEELEAIKEKARKNAERAVPQPEESQ